jgi:hypothetical protein
VAVDGEVREEFLDFVRAHGGRMSEVVEVSEASDPPGVGFFGPRAQVAEPAGFKEAGE